VEEGAWADAVEQVARAAEGVNRTLAEDESITQFEAATAASFVALANARVEVGVVEAGLGGRLDATNTIPSRVTVLTSIGLDHTEWLGETELEIAAEKLAVLRDQTTLVLGEVSPQVLELAQQTVAGHGGRLVRAGDGRGLSTRAPGSFQRRNFATALAAAEAFLGKELDHDLAQRVAATVTVPGRLELVAERPPVYLDAAHNPQGAAAIAESIASVVGGKGIVACLSILADKDAAAMIAALAPALDRAVCTELPPAALEGHGRPGAHSRPAAELVALCERAGLRAEAEPQFAVALERARCLAAEPPEGAVLIAGSHYAIGPARAILGT